MPDRDEILIDLLTITAEIVRRMGASYGNPEDWRRDFTRLVDMQESIVRARLSTS